MRLAQLDRAFGYGPKGRGFESSNARSLRMAETLINTAFPLFFVSDLKEKFLESFFYIGSNLYSFYYPEIREN